MSESRGSWKRRKNKNKNKGKEFGMLFLFWAFPISFSHICLLLRSGERFESRALLFQIFI